MMHVVAGYVNDDERVRNERRGREGGMKKNWKVIGGEGTDGMNV